MILILPHVQWGSFEVHRFFHFLIGQIFVSMANQTGSCSSHNFFETSWLIDTELILCVYNLLKLTLVEKLCGLKIMHVYHCWLSVQFSSVAHSCLTLWEPMNHSMPGLPVHHQLLEFTQPHIHRVNDVNQPPYPLSSPSPPAPNSSKHQCLFQWVNSSHEVAKVLEFQLQHHSFQWPSSTDIF